MKTTILTTVIIIASHHYIPTADSTTKRKQHNTEFNIQLVKVGDSGNGKDKRTAVYNERKSPSVIMKETSIQIKK